MAIEQFKPDLLGMLKRRRRNPQDYIKTLLGGDVSEANVKITLEQLSKQHGISEAFLREVSKYVKAFLVQEPEIKKVVTLEKTIDAFKPNIDDLLEESFDDLLEEGDSSEDDDDEDEDSNTETEESEDSMVNEGTNYIGKPPARKKPSRRGTRTKK
jgi:hypothetical protein